MAPERRGARCGRCGVDAYGAGDPYTIWLPVPRDGGDERRAVHLCRPCARDFASERARTEYLRLVLFA